MSNPKTPQHTRPELLAPAGSADAFHAAIGAGADAVYLGLDGCFNARLRAKNFTVRDLCTLVPYAHSRGVRVYVTLNTLIKQAEIKTALDVLYQLDQIGADAVIVADIGLMGLAKTNFPNLRIHGSTQAAVHNSGGAEVLKTLGCKRVVLARELSLNEIRDTTKNSPIETEVFIHGALCYSISGLCLASSFIGGASGNRGKCTQVCRRRFKCNGQIDPHVGALRATPCPTTPSQCAQCNGCGDNGCDGYFFSPNDLQAAGAIGKLINAGVSCFKIEGRMKGAEYVSTVVRSYRRIIDNHYHHNNNNDIDIVDQAMDELRFDFGREKTAYYLDGRKSGDVPPIDPTRPAGVGLLIGTIVERGESSFVVRAVSDDVPTINSGDRLRIQPNDGFEGVACKVLSAVKSKSNSFYGDGGNPRNAPPTTDYPKTHILKPCYGGLAEIIDYKTSTSKHLHITTSSPIQCNVGDHVFLIGRAESSHNKNARMTVSPSSINLRGHYPHSAKIINGVTPKNTSSNKNNKPRLWFKADCVDWLKYINATPCLHLIFDADFSQIEILLGDKDMINTWRSRISVALPPFIEESRMKFWRHIVNRCAAAGIPAFTISNVGHLPLVKNAKYVTADPLLWCLNKFTQREFKSRGISRFVYSYEDEYLNIRNSTDQVGYANKKNNADHTDIVGIAPIYATPPLFISRMPPAVGLNTTITDPHGDKFFVAVKNNLYYTLPKTPMCLFAKREKLSQCGIQDFLIDVSFHTPSHDTAVKLVAGFKNNERTSDGTIFNFKAGLH